MLGLEIVTGAQAATPKYPGSPVDFKRVNKLNF
jgi:hypothetical protein